jgi:hypothetical protein
MFSINLTLQSSNNNCFIDECNACKDSKEGSPIKKIFSYVVAVAIMNRNNTFNKKILYEDFHVSNNALNKLMKPLHNIPYLPTETKKSKLP